MGGGGVGASEDGGDVFAVDDEIGGERGVGDVGEGWEEVHHAGEGVGGGVGGDVVWPPEDEGHADAAFVGGAFTAAIGDGVAALFFFLEPGAVIAGEDDEGVGVEVEFFEGGEDLGGGPVEFLDDVAVEAAFGFAEEVFAGSDGEVGHGVGEVEEEGVVFVFADDFEGFLGVELGDLEEVDGVGEALVAADEVEGGLVVDVGEAEVGVEALVDGEEGFGVAEVPFADDVCGVAGGVEEFGDVEFVGVEAEGGVGVEDVGGAGGGLVRGDGEVVHGDADGVAAGEEGGAAGGAEGGGGVEVGEAHAFLGHVV